MSLPFSVNNSQRSNFKLTSLIALFTGGLIYTFLRPAEPLFFHWLNWIGIERLIFQFRQYTLPFYTVLPEWFIYSLPGGLWSFSYSLLIISVWGGGTSFIKYLWIGTIPVVIFGFELLQLIGSFPGTFCNKDVFFLFAGMAAAILIKYKNHKNICYEKK